MRGFNLLLKVLFLSLSVSFFSLSLKAQGDSMPPPEPGQSASLSEILNWLDRTSLAHARVGLKSGGASGNHDSPIPAFREDMPGVKMVFSPGFRLTNIDGCVLALSNADAESLAQREQPNRPRAHFAVEFYVWLNRLSSGKGRGPRRLTKNPEQSRLLGVWQTKFTYQGLFSRNNSGISLFPVGSKEQQAHWDGETVTFTFDTREMAEQFDTVFRRAIKLCHVK